MGDKTKIEWTDASWTPIRARNEATGKVGWHCEHVSEGCRNCYAEAINRRLGTGLDFKPGHRGDMNLFLDEWMLTAPLRWTRPRMVFVCSMTDMFADFVPTEWIGRMWSVMSEARQKRGHTFQILTKRIERVRHALGPEGTGFYAVARPVPCPEPNIWIGTSVENRGALSRLDELRQAPAAVRFLSIEPLIEDIGEIDLTGIHWVIVGGESGPDARPFNVVWARSIIAQCKTAGTTCFVKQLGSRPFSAADRITHRGFTGKMPQGFNRYLNDRKGGDMAEWPEDLRVREFPT